MALDELSPVFESVSQYFALLSEPMRLRVLHVLCDGEKSVNDVVERVDSTQSNVSRHLNNLYRAGVLARRREANQVFYRVEDQNFVDMCRTVCVQIAAHMDESRPKKSQFLRVMPKARRAAGSTVQL